MTTHAVGKKAAQTEVIVIGAGMAGLAAARYLHDAGWDVMVVEGRSRVGGRVWTNREWRGAAGQAPLALDLGASWIHGTRGNPLTQLAKAAGVKPIHSDYDNAWTYDTDGQALGDRKVAALETAGAAIVEQITDLGGARQADLSVQAALERTVPLDQYSPAERRRLDFYLNTMLEHELGADIAELSARYTDDTGAFEGGDALFPGGYDVLIQYLIHTAGQGPLDIRLGQVVQALAHDGKGVTVQTNKGEFRGQYAVVTLPLGVLKRGQVRFTPELPQEKRQAIARLGMGLLNKCYLRFPHVFWPPQAELINYIPANKGEWAEWLNLHYYTQEAVLLGFNAGTYGRQLEQMNDAQVTAAAMQTLRRLYGNGIPEPQDCLITRWGLDPFAYGSYSFNAVGSSRGERQALGEPVGERVFFAGEATSEDYPATVHGAYLSGRRAAERIDRL